MKTMEWKRPPAPRRWSHPILNALRCAYQAMIDHLLGSALSPRYEIRVLRHLADGTDVEASSSENQRIA